MTTAIGIVDAAYRQANMDQVPSSFSTTQEFPYNIALDILNTTLQEVNRASRFWFEESSQVLTYPWNVVILGDTRTSNWALTGVCQSNATANYAGETVTLNNIIVNDQYCWFTVSTSGAIDLYQDINGINLIASGVAPASLPGTCTLTAQNGSGVYGTVIVASGSAETIGTVALRFVPTLQNSYNLGTVASVVIDPHNVTRLRRESLSYEGEVHELNYRAFQKKCRYSTPSIQTPRRWSKFDNFLYLDVYPDQDYTLTLYYYQDIPQVVNTTDTLVVPIKYEDIVREGVYAYLAQRVGRPDAMAAYELYTRKLEKLVADTKKDTGLPNQWPAAF
jgi:hypothetical protein